MASDAQTQNSSLWLIILILLLLILGIFFALPSYNTRVNSTTQSATPGQCPTTGQDFDAQQEAFVLAQSAELYRRTHPFGGNYGLGSYTICFTDGTFQRMQSIPFKGYDNDSYPENNTHSEQSVYGWLQNQLSRLSLDTSKITAIYTVIFSQVQVCPPCKKDMVYWQRTLRQKAKTDNVFLSIWDVAFQRGFNPKTYPAGRKSAITSSEVEKVAIEYAT